MGAAIFPCFEVWYLQPANLSSLPTAIKREQVAGISPVTCPQFVQLRDMSLGKQEVHKISDI